MKRFLKYTLITLLALPLLAAVPARQAGKKLSAELSLAGVKSITPIDETIGVMYAVGRSIPTELRETSLGGMAVAKSAC